ncbi:hypothetical protein BsWGS_18978 [Bradybaena similaris]
MRNVPAHRQHPHRKDACPSSTSLLTPGLTSPPPRQTHPQPHHLPGYLPHSSLNNLPGFSSAVHTTHPRQHLC